MIALVIALALAADPGVARPGDALIHLRVQPVSRVADPAPVLEGVAVTVECTAHTDGRVDGCMVLGETHPGLGFGTAAVALMNGSDVAPGPRDLQFARTIQFTP